MCGQSQNDKSSDNRLSERPSLDKSIGDLFRDYGEEYIRIFKPELRVVKLIRAIRVCKTPALGGKMISCNSCDHKKVIYKSCGHSQCPVCQYNKRQQWKDKLCIKLLQVPYSHTVFTIPHELNPLCKSNKKVMYNIIMRASWQCIKELSAKQENVGALPGMISVLHTFGSDMKYHLHVHSLITFGGIDKNGKWRWPKRKNKIAGYRDLCKTFRKVFLNMLDKELAKGNVIPDTDIEELLDTVGKVRWNVRHPYPTIDLGILETYLARYINRIAISKSRFEYLAEQKIVNIIYKDYRNQQDGEPAPLGIKKIKPLLAIDQFLMHVLPAYFQKSRYCGLHASATMKKYKECIEEKLKNNSDSIVALFRLLKALLKLAPYKCEKCESCDYEIKGIKKDVNWIFYFITLPNLRGPPQVKADKIQI